MPMNRFRILSLDGGGIMGAFSAAVLATFEKVTGRRIVEHFDLITGTSTGGIIAIGLAMGASAQEVCSFYETRGPQIFPAGGGMGGWIRLLRNLVRPKFSPQALRKAIQQVVGDRPLAEAKTRLVVPAYNAEMGRVYVFKTPHHPWYEYDRDLPAVDVALATSAAPTSDPMRCGGTAAAGRFRGEKPECVFLGGRRAHSDGLAGVPERARRVRSRSFDYKMG